ncbi:MAG: pilus assembly protein [Acidobacteria bacterium]|nr:pilus assembly protein [Acidobacteriota bacterium]
MTTRRQSRAGSELIEFAFVLPLLLVLVFGMVDFGIALYNKAIVTAASREGARAGTAFRTPPLSDGAVAQLVRDYCEDRLINFGGASTTPRVEVDPAPPPGSQRRVRVEYEHHFAVISALVGLFDEAVADSVLIQAATTMRME